MQNMILVGCGCKSCISTGKTLLGIAFTTLSLDSRAR